MAKEKHLNYLTIEKVTIVGAANGYIIKDSEGEFTVVEEEDTENGEIDALISLLYRIKEHFLQEDPFRSDGVVAIIRAAGDEYRPIADEVAIPLDSGPLSLVVKKATLRNMLEDSPTDKEQ